MNVVQCQATDIYKFYFKNVQEKLAKSNKKLMKKAQAFKSFFKKDNGPVKVDDSEKDEKVEEVRGNFTVFRVKKNMRLAPTVRGEEGRLWDHEHGIF